MGTKRKTNEQFLEDLKQKRPDIEALDIYTKSDIKIHFKCKICGNVWEAKPNNILINKTNCPECTKKKLSDLRSNTHESYVERYYQNQKHSNIKILSKYKNVRDKMLFKCNICLYEWNTLPLDALKGGCPKCSFSLKKDTDTFLKELSDINNTIILLDNYKNAHSPVKCQCGICGNTWESQPSNLLKGYGCPICAFKNISITEDEFFNKFKKIDNIDIEIIGEYKGYKNKIECKCTKCGHIWNSSTPKSIVNGTRCPNCANNAKKIPRISKEEFINKLSKINNSIKIIGKYKNTNTKVECECVECNAKWMALPRDLIHKQSGCPHCGMSKGEKAIKGVLEKFDYAYKTQYSISDCKSKIALRFDFAVYNKNKLLFLCEYQGQQHFEPVDFSGKGKEWAETLFQDNIKRDDIKREYCKNNNIPLLEISYLDYDNIENILGKYLEEVA